MKLFGGSSKDSDKKKNPKKVDKSLENTGFDELEKGSEKKKKVRGWIIALIVVALIVGGAALYWTITTRPPEIGTKPPATSDDANQEQAEAPNGRDGRYYTTLIVGDDQEGGNTDVIMLLRFDSVENKANVVSIPRDTLVNVEWNNKKINSVYHYNTGGIEALMDEVEKIAGFRPDNYVIIQTEAFEKIVDAMGGIWFDVPRDMNYDDYSPEKDYVFTIHLEAGYQLLNGYDALGLVRFRQNNDGTGYESGDIERIDVQHDFLKEAFGQLMDTSWSNLLEIMWVALDNSETDLKIGNLQWYGKKLLAMDAEDISFATIPANYFCHIRNSGYVSIQAEEWVEMLNEQFNPMNDPIKVEDLEILYQVAYDHDSYDLSPDNYLTTNGADIAGGLNSFMWVKPS